jgi:hypothetical protein
MKKNAPVKVRYIVEYWFNSSDIYDNLESAQRNAKNLAELPQYKDIRIIKLLEEKEVIS